MGSQIVLMQNDEDSRIIALTRAVGTAAPSAVDLTGLMSAKLQIINSARVVLDQLELGDGLAVVSATGGTIRATFSPERTATPGDFFWRIILEWIDGEGPLTWPLSSPAPSLRIFPSTTTGTATERRVYYGVGVAGLTSTTTLGYSDDYSTLYFTTPDMSPSNQKIYVAYPASWGYAQLYVDGLRQTEAFGVSAITVGADSYYLYESTQLLTTTDIAIEVRS